MTHQPTAPPPPAKRRCVAFTAAGRPCRAWAMPGTEPPLCAAHRPREPGSPPEEERALGGFYTSILTPQELHDLLASGGEDDGVGDEILCARVSLRRVLSVIKEMGVDARPEVFARLIEVALESLRTIGRLARDQRTLAPREPDAWEVLMREVTDEALDAWGEE